MVVSYNSERMRDMAAESNLEPFKPSWIDRFNEWVEKLPVRPWIFYLLTGVVLILVQILFLWLDSGPFAEELLPVIIFNALAVPYLLAVILLLDRLALDALKIMKPVLDMTGQEFEKYQYKISTMPVRAPLLAGLAMMGLAILTSLVATEPDSYTALAQLSLFTAVFRIVDISSAFLFGVVFYHTIRQLRLVNEINAQHVRIDLFHLKPVQAFSRLTAATALSLLLFIYGWMFINPELLADPLILGLSVLLTILAVLVFIWPLWGVHRRMEVEKEGALLEINRRFETLFVQFNQHLADGDYAAAEELNGLIASMAIQHGKIGEIPTWPWRSETARVVLTAIALPLMLMILQFFVGQALGG
jgi:hypothetical protein